MRADILTSICQTFQDNLVVIYRRILPSEAWQPEQIYMCYIHTIFLSIFHGYYSCLVSLNFPCACILDGVDPLIIYKPQLMR